MASDFEKQAQEIVERMEDAQGPLDRGSYQGLVRFVSEALSSTASSAASAARAQAVEECTRVAESQWDYETQLIGDEAMGCRNEDTISWRAAQRIRALAPTPPAAAQLAPEVEKLVKAASHALKQKTMCDSHGEFYPRKDMAERLDLLRAALAPFRAKDDK